MTIANITRIIALAGAATFVACAPTSNVADQSRDAISFDASDTTYFSKDDAATQHVDRFAGPLQYLHEPSFENAIVPSGATALRLFWRRSFHPHVSVRVQAAGARCRVVTTSVGPAEFEWSAPDSLGLSVPLSVRAGLILRRDSTTAPIAACTALADESRRALESLANAPPDSPSVDGFDWMLEVLDRSGHRAISRFSPDSLQFPALWRAATGILRLGNALPPGHPREF